MDNTLLRKVQLTQLDIAKEIKRICDANGISYFMDGGTLLGAVRHKGFIPWDDDMDFGMLREEYERFLSVANKELSDAYILQTWETDKTYGMPFAKVKKRGTLYIERVAQETDTNQGVFVDIFPYDNYPVSSGDQRQLFIHLTLLKMLIKVKEHYKPWHDREKINYKRMLVYIPIRLLALFCKTDSLKSTYSKWATKFNGNPSEYVYAQVAEKSCSWKMKLAYIETTCDLPFEDTLFCAPEQYDAYLRDGYGDYMIPPPPEKRGNVHGVMKIQL